MVLKNQLAIALLLVHDIQLGLNINDIHHSILRAQTHKTVCRTFLKHFFITVSKIDLVTFLTYAFMRVFHIRYFDIYEA